MPTPKQINDLAEAVWQVLDDMGADGKCVCLAAKAQLRVAYEPFRENDVPVDMPLEAAQAIINDLDQYH